MKLFLNMLMILYLLITSNLCASETIYALMITGKDAYHHKLALKSIRSFKEQTYKNKVLIIVNDGEFTYANPEISNIKEIKVPKQNTLGDLRNISLEAIPEGAVWIQWDDDDWHHPTRMAEQYQFMKKNNLGAVCLVQQLQYSSKLNSAWIMHSYEGIAGTMVARSNKNVRYSSKIRGEDTDFFYSTRKNMKLGAMNNPPELYVRLIHGNNTWDEEHFYLSKRKSNDFSIPGKSKKYLDNIINTHYKFLQ
jgi:glycosyltransferase involved in cell wall biosynthesis